MHKNEYIENKGFHFENKIAISEVSTLEIAILDFLSLLFITKKFFPGTMFCRSLNTYSKTVKDNKIMAIIVGLKFVMECPNTV